MADPNSQVRPELGGHTDTSNRTDDTVPLPPGVSVRHVDGGEEWHFTPDPAARRSALDQALILDGPFPRTIRLDAGPLPIPPHIFGPVPLRADGSSDVALFHMEVNSPMPHSLHAGLINSLLPEITVSPNGEFTMTFGSRHGNDNNNGNNVNRPDSNLDDVSTSGSDDSQDTRYTQGVVPLLRR